jgi:cytidylate kinase
MSVITISRGTFSGGKMLAECLAAKLGFRCIDRDAIVAKAATPDVSQEILREALVKPPSFLERYKHRKYIYLALIQAALADEVRTGKVVYHGNAGHLLLPGGTPVLRVRIIAPLEFRVQMAMERENLNREGAISYIQKVDQDRQKWTQYLYGVDWNDPALYDVFINLEYLSIDQACEGRFRARKPGQSDPDQLSEDQGPGGRSPRARRASLHQGTTHKPGSIQGSGAHGEGRARSRVARPGRTRITGT